ncbi:DUF7144 family membrane protein [Saccharopolyspora mangrovi]|uniref:DUF7144 domain-containing protein n=1 Tax=Saccharopolyspora mangrovi TaxID=3082379 RepID=A0ABU6A3B7_9PSEU|nr:hypothetical protein [Saccharopolyspora sp. S2-29]MEB3365927.1 hypothetical protein [Saccharopolyspora sp. S2-29]
MSSPETGKQAGGQHRAGQGVPEQQVSEPRAPEAGREWAVSRARSDAAGSGWLAFGGWMLVLAGAFNVISGLTSLLRPDYFVADGDELLVFDFGAWGYIWLAVGILAVLTGAGCLAGQRWARMIGVGLAGLSAIAHLAFMAAFPLWSLASIALAVLVMYAMVVPDRDAVA